MKNKIYIYVPSYCLSHYDLSRLTDMSLQTTKKGIEMAREMKMRGDNPVLIFSTAYPVLWEKEADIKKKMALEAGLSPDNFIIIPETTDSFNEAGKIRAIVSNRLIGCHGSILFVVAEKLHASRATFALQECGVEVNGTEGVKARIERAAEPSWIKSIRSSNVVLYALWQWIFYLLTPYMVRREKIKQKGR